MSFCIFFFSNCSKEGELKYNSINDSIKLRQSGNPECSNLIRNGDFEDLSCEGWSTFPNGCVNSWSCLYGTADVINNENHWGLWNSQLEEHWSDYFFDSNWAFMCSGNITDAVSTHDEGIYQKTQPLDLTCDLSCGPRYYLSFDYSTTHYQTTQGDNGGLCLEVSLSEDLDENQFFHETLAACNLEPDDNSIQYIVPIPNNSVPLPITEHFCQLLNTEATAIFGAGGPFINYLSIQAITTVPYQEQEGERRADGVFIDNVAISCEDPRVKGIVSEQIESCAFSFEADLGFENEEIVQIIWEMGDGQEVLNETEFSYTYQNQGTYEIVLKVIDYNGCCTDVNTIVTCEEDPPCLYFVCWEDLQPIRYFEELVITNSQNIIFDPSILIEGGYYELLVNVLQDLESEPYGTFSMFHSNYPCLKENEAGSSPVPGFFFLSSDLEFDSFSGIDTEGNPVSVPFEVYNCD